jgi:alpha-tubulin suppressor-like RCC1 family protein
MRLPRFIAPHGLRLAAVALALSALPAQAAPPVTITPVAGAAHSFFLDSLGRAWAAGDNRYGQLGDGSTHPNLTVAVRVRENVTSISAGTNHTLFLDTDGSVWATGHNLHGQLGDGSIANRRSPVRVQFDPGTVISAVAGGDVCACNQLLDSCARVVLGAAFDALDALQLAELAPATQQPKQRD